MALRMLQTVVAAAAAAAPAVAAAAVNLIGLKTIFVCKQQRVSSNHNQTKPTKSTKSTQSKSIKSKKQNKINVSKVTQVKSRQPAYARTHTCACTQRAHVSVKAVANI